jgi:DNA-binding response OmpR family regulator
MASVLIVDDEDRLRRILMLNLARRGYAVVEATSVATAIEALETFPEPFDLILLDINLPDATGWDVLRYLRPTDDVVPPLPMQRPKVIVMTAVRPAECRLDEFHPDGVLVKPFPIEALVRLVERMLRSPDAKERHDGAAGDELEAADDETPSDASYANEHAPPAGGSGRPEAAAG